MSLVDSAKEVAGLFEKAEERWSAYVEGVRAALREWERFRPLLAERISVLKTRIRMNLEEEQELNLKVELGLVDEEKAKRKLELLRSETPALIEELSDLWVRLEELTLRSIIHTRRIGSLPDVTEEEVRAKMKELEECAQSSLVSEEALERLRGLLERQLAALRGLPPQS